MPAIGAVFVIFGASLLSAFSACSVQRLINTPRQRIAQILRQSFSSFRCHSIAPLLSDIALSLLRALAKSCLCTCHSGSDILVSKAARNTEGKPEGLSLLFPCLRRLGELPVSSLRCRIQGTAALQPSGGMAHFLPASALYSSASSALFSKATSSPCM